MLLQAPPRLKPGDTAYIISPSAGLIPFAPERTRRATNNATDLGLNVKFARHASQNNGYVSGSVEERVADIHEAFSDPTCSLVIASIGGDHCNQLINHLDYELIKANPKIVIGYSDITVLHYAIATQAGIQTYYGPCFLNQFGEFPEILAFTKTNLKQVLFESPTTINLKASETYTDEVLDWFKNEDSIRPRKQQVNTGLDWWRTGKVDGWAFPATLPSLMHLVGTKFMPPTTGAVFMIDIPEGNTFNEGLPLSSVDAYLTDLDNIGVLQNIAGMIIGRPYKYTQSMIDELKLLVLKITQKYNYPILFNVNIGHVDPILTIPIGSKLYLDSKKSWGSDFR